MADQAARFATGLAGLGVRPGDRLVVLMANCPEVLVTYNAAWRAGAVVTPLIFLVSEDELRHALADSGAVAVVTTPEFLPKVQGAARGVDSVRFIVVAGADWGRRWLAGLMGLGWLEGLVGLAGLAGRGWSASPRWRRPRRG